MKKEELIAVYLALRLCYSRLKAEKLFRKIIDLL